MSAAMVGEKKVILGYGGFEKLPGLLNKFYRYEALHIAVQYMSYALAGKPYMGVGRNMAYLKELFFQTKGFIKHRHIASGDDDLLVNEVSTGENTTIVIHANAHTISEPKNTWSEWWTQKRRHLSTSGLYRWESKVLLGIYNLTTLGFYLGFFVVLAIPALYWTALVALGIKWICHLSIMRVPTRVLNERDLLLFSLLGDVFSPFFNAFASISILIKRPIVWK
jgi:cellulose synthase/poly-beta-1,6-N-acetylglucosamine synthase-like glycosyltransferase